MKVGNVKKALLVVSLVCLISLMLSGCAVRAAKKIADNLNGEQSSSAPQSTNSSTNND